MITITIIAFLTALAVFYLLVGVNTPKHHKIIIILVIPLGVLSLYLFLGNPDVPSSSALFEQTGPRAERRALVKKELVLMDTLSNEPDNVDLMLALGAVRVRNGRLNDAISILEAALELDTKNKDIRTELGAAYYAAALSEIVLQENPDQNQMTELLQKSLKVAPPDAPYIKKLKQDLKRFQLEN